jgi:hypothetical protein
LALSAGLDVPANVNLPLNTPFTNSVDVLKEINLSAVGSVLPLGSGTPGTASIASIGQTFSAENATGTPEPGTFFLGGCGLLGFGLALRRRAKAASKTQDPCLMSK